MNLSINGQSQVPPGFRFHPTEEELLHYYLRKKVAYEKIDLDVIREVDLNKLEPWDIQEKCKIGSTPQNDWYFFSHKDKKYPTGTRTNRATTAGFWKATGRDKIIYSCFKRIGLRKTLVFYKGRAPHGQKSDWIMHEYRLDDNIHDNNMNNIGWNSNSNSVGESMSEDGWVVCRVFRKKNYQKALESPKSCSTYSMDSKAASTQMLGSSSDGVLDQILLYMGRNATTTASTCKMENNIESLSNMNIISNNNNMRLMFAGNNNNTGGGNNTINGEGLQSHERFMHLPRLESPTNTPTLPSSVSLLPMMINNTNFKSCYDQSMDEMLMVDHQSLVDQDTKSIVNDWVTLDRLVASQLNGHQVETTFGLCPDDDEEEEDQELSQSHDLQLHTSNINEASQVYSSCNHNQNDLWSSFTNSSSSSDPLCHLSV